MKKVGIIMMVFGILFSGCSKKEEFHKISELENNKVDSPTEVDCFLGSGSCVTLTNSEHMNNLLLELLKIEADVQNTKQNIHIDDGDMAFIFKNSDGSDVTFGFCTSEYYSHDGKYLPVKTPSSVNKICEMARDYAEMEREVANAMPDANTLILNGQQIDIEYIDNGCEARNVMVLCPSWNGQELALEGVYSIEECLEGDNGMLIRCTTGDYYSHDLIQEYLLTVEDNQLVVQEQ